jgi:hypothetical protein
MFFKHPNNIDLCAMPLEDTIMSIRKNIGNGSRQVFYHSLDIRNIVNFETEQAIQDVLMVGYPIGISDDKNNLPIIRKGLTASHLRKNFQGKPEVLIDAACFPGSSGSPVFLSSSSKTNSNFEAKLLGVLWGGPQHNATGNIMIDDNQQMIPTPLPTVYTQTLMPSHLGYVIKSTELAKIRRR